MNSSPLDRTVFIISDGTGITAETFSHSVLSQFESVSFKQVRMPFVDTVEKADGVVGRINRCAIDQGNQPIVFTTLVNPEILARVKAANALFLDLFGAFVEPLEHNLGVKSSHSIGKSHLSVSSIAYRNRIEAINFSLAHDDGQFIRGLAQADVYLAAAKHQQAYIWLCNTGLKPQTFLSSPKTLSATPCQAHSPNTNINCSGSRFNLNV